MYLKYMYTHHGKYATCDMQCERILKNFKIKKKL